MLEQIDHFDLIAALQMLLTEHLEVGKGSIRFRGLARHVQAQLPDLWYRRLLRARLGPLGLGGSGHLCCPRGGGALPLWWCGLPVLVDGPLCLPAALPLSPILPPFIIDQ